MWDPTGGQPRQPKELRAEPRGAAEFPDTRTSLLEQAAAGEWEPFLQQYLAPCWREITICCRQQKIPLADADDLFQELIVRVIREGQLRSIPDQFGQRAKAPVSRSNIPGRFLQYREAAMQSARFRTVLKAVIGNLILESLRGRARQPQSLTGDVVDPAPRVDESVSDSVERHWMGECLEAAALRLQDESRTARTKGARRLFDVFYRSTVRNDSPGLISTDFGVDRSTIAGLLTRARGRFIDLVREVSGVDDVHELKSIIERMPDRLVSSLEPGRRRTEGPTGSDQKSD